MIGINPFLLAGRMGRAAWAGMGSTGRATAIGALAGAGWGAMSSDTSVLGGALIGAGIGRYGAAGVRRGILGYRGIGVPGVGGVLGAARGFGRGALNVMRQDFRGARLMANQGYSKIRSGMKAGYSRGWSMGFRRGGFMRPGEGI